MHAPTPPAAQDAAPDDPVMAAFKRAAAELEARRAEEALPVEDRIVKSLRKWVAEWGADLDQRPDDAKNAPSGEVHAAAVPQLYCGLPARLPAAALRVGHARCPKGSSPPLAVLAAVLHAVHAGLRMRG